MIKIKILEEKTAFRFSILLNEAIEQGYKVIHSNLAITGDEKNLIKRYYAYLEKEIN